jgi:Raf kinase inhibitor-like YbhB/YbcL family protein
MKLISNTFADGAALPQRSAFCKPDPDTHVTFSDNRSPHLGWSELPPGTRSLAILCIDPDAPSVGDDVNQEGREISADLPRVTFTHWILVDIPSARSELAEGTDSKGVTAKGKTAGATKNGVRGINDYTGWFAGDPDMAGNYGGYDGPCPPWNDARVHRYVFTAYALDAETLGLSGSFGRDQVVEAMKGHILASASVTGTHTLNPAIIDRMSSRSTRR